MFLSLFKNEPKISLAPVNNGMSSYFYCIELNNYNQTYWKKQHFNIQQCGFTLQLTARGWVHIVY